MTGKNPLAYETRNNTYELLKPAEPRAGKVVFLLPVVRSFLCCVPRMNSRRTTIKGGWKTPEEEDKHREPKTRPSRPQRHCGCVCLMFRGDPVWYGMIRPEGSFYHFPYYAISQDTIHLEIVSMYRILRTDIEISYAARICLDPEHQWVLLKQGKGIMNTE